MPGLGFKSTNDAHPEGIRTYGVQFVQTVGDPLNSFIAPDGFQSLHHAVAAYTKSLVSRLFLRRKTTKKILS
ncbi:MAG TPA: hypothetical protein DCS88_11085 [Alphaproteobacteria bacterium]|nr:hypothetical protein [Alphaproteobacteria bacterium]